MVRPPARPVPPSVRHVQNGGGEETRGNCDDIKGRATQINGQVGKEGRSAHLQLVFGSCNDMRQSLDPLAFFDAGTPKVLHGEAETVTAHRVITCVVEWKESESISRTFISSSPINDYYRWPFESGTHP